MIILKFEMNEINNMNEIKIKILIPHLVLFPPSVFGWGASSNSDEARIESTFVTLYPS